MGSSAGFVDRVRPPRQFLSMNSDRTPFSFPGGASVVAARSFFSVGLAIMGFAGSVFAADSWPGFRGPSGDGHAAAPGESKLAGLPMSRYLACAAFERAQSNAMRLAFKQRKSVLTTDTWMEDALSFTGVEDV